MYCVHYSLCIVCLQRCLWSRQLPLFRLHLSQYSPPPAPTQKRSMVQCLTDGVWALIKDPPCVSAKLLRQSSNLKIILRTRETKSLNGADSSTKTKKRKREKTIGTCHQSLTPAATDPPPANSPTMQRRLVCQKRFFILGNQSIYP